MASRSSSTSHRAASSSPPLSTQPTGAPPPLEGSAETKGSPRIGPQAPFLPLKSSQPPGLRTLETGGATGAPGSPRGNGHGPQASTSAPNSPRWNASTTPSSTVTPKVTLATRRASVSEAMSPQPGAQAEPGRGDTPVGAQRSEEAAKSGATVSSRASVDAHTPLSAPPAYADLFPTEDGSASDSADGADSDSESDSRGIKRAPGGRDAPDLKDKPAKAARRADTLSPGQSHKDGSTERQISQDTWKAHRPSGQNAHPPLIEHHRAKSGSPKVPALNLMGAQLAGADSAASSTLSTSSTSSTSSASSIPNTSATASTSTPVFVSTATLSSGAPTTAIAPNLSPRRADGGEGGAASRRSGSPLHTLTNPYGARPQSPRGLLKITVTSAPKATNAADAAPGKELGSSSGSQPPRIGPSPRTRADELGFDLLNLPDRFAQPVALPSSPRPSSPRDPAPYDPEAAVAKAIAHAERVGERVFQIKPGKEQEKGSH